MDSRALAFVEVMAGIAVVGLVAFLIFLVASQARRPGAAAPEGGGPAPGPRWYEILLALILLVVIAAGLIWQFWPMTGLEKADWRADSRSTVFIVVMLVAGAMALVGFLVVLFTRIGRRSAGAAAPRQAAAEAPPGIETPPAARLLGLLLFGLAFLLLNWIYVPAEQQYALMLYLMYPAGLAVALVLLFDKATRAWATKGPGETIREWLYCDGIAFLLILGFLNLLQSGADAKYAAMFWDFVHIVVFFFVFWLVDRRATRYRFLVATGYLVLLPILLLIWQVAQQVPAVEDLSWWGTIWPVFFLAGIFFVLEIIALIATKEGDKPTAATIKDVVFLVLYGILLVAAIPEAAA